MRITSQEVAQLEKGVGTAGWEWFARNPHLLMALDFVEYRGFRNSREYYDWCKVPYSRHVLAPGVPQSIYKDDKGVWWALVSASVVSRTIEFVPVKDFGRPEEELDDILEYGESKSLDEVIRRLRLRCDRWIDEEKRFQFPDPKLYGVREDVRLELLEASSRLLYAIRKNVITLQGLDWQQLEDLVGALLRERGLSIYPVNCTPQGGRDLIAQGRLIPDADPVTIAIEVKHQPVVGRPVLATALSQNRHFPAMMLVTSGRFTSGVIKEKHAPDNHFRLFLKDGVALEALIRSPHVNLADP